MNPLLKAYAGTFARWLMVLAGSHGVSLGNEDAATIVNAGLIVVPLLWSAYQKWRAHERIETAEMQVKLGSR